MNTEIKTHSPIGASTCERWSNCPGSIALAKDLPEPSTSVYAVTGTIAHMLCEKYLNAYQKLHQHQKSKTIISELPNIQDEIGRSYIEPESGMEIEVTDDMVDAVNVYIDVIFAYIREYNLDIVRDVRAEVGFQLKHIDEEAFGTCDCQIIVPMNRLIVIDYKHGKGKVVEVEGNKQLQYYALGAYYDLPEHDRLDIGYIELVIVQPRAEHISGAVRRFVYRVGDLLAFEAELTAAVKRVRAGDTTLQAGTWCGFCRAKAVCTETRRRIQDNVGIVFANIETAKIELPPPQSLSPERLARLMENAEEIRDWCSSVVSLANALAINGTQIPGYKVVEYYSRRRWKDEGQVIELYKELGDSIFTKKLKSPKGLEDILGKGRKSELVDLYETTLKGKTLVKENDNREETATGVAAVFANVEI